MPIRRNPRLIIFVLVTILAGLLYGNAVTLLPVPWTGISVVRPGATSTDLRWDLALMGASTGLMLGATLLTLAWRPLTKPLLVQFIAVSIVVDGCLQVPFRGPAYLLLALPAVAVVATYPRLRSLTEVRPERRLRRPFVLLGAVTGLALLVRVAVAVRQQIVLAGVDPSANLGWVDDAAHTTWIAVGALLTVTGRPGWRILGAAVALSLCYLGVTSVTLLEARGSWGPTWGVLAGIAGLAYLAAATWPNTVTTEMYTAHVSDVPAPRSRAAR